MDAIEGDLPSLLRRRAPKKESFAYAVDWFVQRRVNPGFDRRAGVYQDAWKGLDNQMFGLGQSKFSSSAWKAEFYRELAARPLCHMEKLDANNERRGETCNACGRSNHPSTHMAIFSGRPYDRTTLEELPQDDDGDEDDEEDEAATDDGQGNPLKPERHEWVLGAVCANNAEQAHRLRHWLWALGSFVDGELRKEGHLGGKYADRILWPAWKSEARAETIMEAWAAKGGLIDSLYGEFKQLREKAEVTKTTQRR